MIAFKHQGAPKDDSELGQHLEEIRANVLIASKGEVSPEVMEKIESAVRAGHEAVEAAKADRAKVANLEEMVRVLHESGHSSNDGIEKGLRSLPQVFKAEKDPEVRGRIAQKPYNVLALSRKDLKLYLSGDALDWALRFRKLNDMARSAHDILMLVVGNDPTKMEAYHRSGGIKGTELWGPLQECWKQGARALDTATSGGVSEWIPTLYSSDKFDETRDRLTFGSQFRWLPMPQSPWTLPTLLGFMTAYKVPESLADDNSGDTAIPASDPQSGNRTLTAVKIATLSHWSRESDQDSIVAILPMYDEEMAYAHAFAVDTAIASGQLTGAIDTVSIAATDARKLWDGLRYSAKLYAQQVDFSTGMTGELLTSMIGKAGKFADLQHCRFFTGYAGLARALILKDAGGNLLYMTRDRAGEAATMFAGTVGVLMGYPLVVGGAYPQNMNSTGVVDGAVGSTKTGILFANTNQFIGAQRQGLEVTESEHVKFAYDQKSIRSIQRATFRSLIPASASRPIAVEGVNLATF